MLGMSAISSTKNISYIMLTHIILHAYNTSYLFNIYFKFARHKFRKNMKVIFKNRYDEDKTKPCSLNMEPLNPFQPEADSFSICKRKFITVKYI